MTDQLLGILKLALLGLLYLFFARVLWTVWVEVRGPRPGPAGQPTPAGAAATTVAPAKPAKVKSTRAAGGKGPVTRMVVLEPAEHRGQSFTVGGDLTMGRSPGCTVSVPDDTFMSQVHARIFTTEGSVWVEDLGSTNGTFVNGRRITASETVSRGDRLQVGHTVLEAQ
jgi:pSer/pThr/pTyr-binding forkhead associated (FHA) protein